MPKEGMPEKCRPARYQRNDSNQCNPPLRWSSVLPVRHFTDSPDESEGWFSNIGEYRYLEWQNPCLLADCSPAESRESRYMVAAVEPSDLFGAGNVHKAPFSSGNKRPRRCPQKSRKRSVRKNSDKPVQHEDSEWLTPLPYPLLVMFALPVPEDRGQWSRAYLCPIGCS